MESTPALQTPDDRAREPTALSQMKQTSTFHHPINGTPAAGHEQHAMSTAQMHAVGSIADMSATWSAKVVAAANEQTDRTKMGGVYDSMAATFVQSGLSLESITAVRQLYGNLETQPEPLYYEQFPTPLQPGAVRLVVLQPEPQDPFIKLTSDACQDVFRSIPSGMQPHASLPENYHLTVFMTSQPGDPRPDPFIAEGGIDPTHPPVPIPAPTAATLQKEIETFRQIALTARPAFEVHSVVFANSGTLLLCFVDTTGKLAGMRQQIRQAFPGGSSKQSSIMHMTLGRVLQPRQLTLEQRQAIQQRCSHWSQQLKGTVFKPDTLWHCQEHQFTTVTGQRVPLPLGQ